MNNDMEPEIYQSLKRLFKHFLFEKFQDVHT